jgi:hypothetical protein
MGLVLPKLTMMAGTALIGVTAITLGAGTLVTVYRPDGWQVVQQHPGWFVAGLAGIWVVSILAQSNQGNAAAAQPAAVPAAG